jgi:hypothetical protein
MTLAAEQALEAIGQRLRRRRRCQQAASETGQNRDFDPTIVTHATSLASTPFHCPLGALSSREQVPASLENAPVAL